MQVYYVFRKNDGGLPNVFESKEKLSLWLQEGKYPPEALIIIKGSKIDVEIKKEVIINGD